MAQQAPQPLIPWGVAIGPLALGNQLHDMLASSQKILPKFSGNRKVTTNQHINAFFIESEVLAIQHEDVSIHLFFETLIEATTEWFG